MWLIKPCFTQASYYGHSNTLFVDVDLLNFSHGGL